MLHGRRSLPKSLQMLPLSTWPIGLSQNLDYAKYRLDLHPDLMNIVFITDIHTDCKYNVRFNAYCHGKPIDDKEGLHDNEYIWRGGSTNWEYYDNLSTTNKLDRICVLIKKLSKLKKIDLIILGGDYLLNDPNTTAENAKKAFYEINSCIKKLRDIAPILICKGNHDSNTMNTFDLRVVHQDYIDLIYNDIPISNNVVYGNANRDYGYYDDASKKIRVIYLNSNEINVENIPEYVAYSGKLSDLAYRKYNPHYTPFMSQTQLEFLINALTIKDNGWTVVIFEHHPVDDFRYFDNGTPNYVANIFASFRHNKKGTYLKTWSSSTLFNLDISWDFTENGTNNAIFFINGHIHNPKSISTIYTNPTGDTVSIEDPNNSNRFVITGISAEALSSENVDVNKARESSFDIIQVNTSDKSLIFNHIGGKIDPSSSNLTNDNYGGSSRIMYEDDAIKGTTNRYGITNNIGKYYTLRLTKTINITVTNSEMLNILNAYVTLSFNGFDKVLNTNGNGIASFICTPYDKFVIHVTAEGYQEYTESIYDINLTNKSITLTRNE